MPCPECQAGISTQKRSQRTTRTTMIRSTIPGITMVAPIGSANAGAMPSPFFDAISLCGYPGRPRWQTSDVGAPGGAGSARDGRRVPAPWRARVHGPPPRGATGMVRALGEVTEWLKVRDWKSRGRVKPPRGFESHPLGSNPTLSAECWLDSPPGIRASGVADPKPIDGRGRWPKRCSHSTGMQARS